jgi:hypothetical protein
VYAVETATGECPRESSLRQESCIATLALPLNVPSAAASHGSLLCRYRGMLLERLCKDYTAAGS